MIKTRIENESNYKAIWFNGKTIRTKLDANKPITELNYPEFYDIKITNYCLSNCDYCYQSSSNKSAHFGNILNKITKVFGTMTINQRPFQIAIGGGEPTGHPDFIDSLKLLYELGIEPNYTTNGMFVEQSNFSEILEATKTYCGGVALSCHEHLDSYWIKALKIFRENKVKTNLHIIISDKHSIDRMLDIYQNYKDLVDYFVLLPYEATGRAKPKTIDWDYLVKQLPDEQSKFAFGANFYPYLLKHDHNIKVSLYEPEIMSKYIDLKDMNVYQSSFSNEPIKTIQLSE